MKTCEYCKKPGRFDNSQRKVLCKEHNEEAEFDEMIERMYYMYIAS